MRARLLGWPGQVGILLKEKGFLKERYLNKNFRTFIRLIFRSNFFQNLVFFRKNAYSKERFKKKFERTKFERKNEFRKNVI